SCKIKELIELVRSYVSNNPAKVLLVKKPIRARLDIHSMRSQAYCLDNLTNSTFVRQFPSLDSRTVFKPFAVHDGLSSSGLFLYPPNFSKLSQAGNARPIWHTILPMLHHPDA